MPATTDTPPSPAALGVLKAYADAVHAKDLPAFVALYEPGVRVFDLWAAWACDGADRWGATAADWFASLGDERVAVTWDDVRTLAFGDLVVAHATLDYAGVSAAGEKLRSMQNRLTWALRRGADGRWRIAHEHTSAPADFETGKVQLKR